MSSKLKRIKPCVEHVLRDYPIARDSDRRLIMIVGYLYFNHCGGTFIDDTGKERWGFDLAHPDAPNPESIRRWRQKIQQGGKYMPTSEKIAKQRRLNMDLWREAMGYNV